MSDNKVSTLKYFIAGGFGGICTVVTGHPMDTIKVRLQTMPTPALGKPALYNGTIDCVKKTFINEGITGFYKGMGAPLTGVSPIFALSFFGYAVGKKMQQTHDNEQLSLVQLFLAGAFSGVFTTTIMAPGERIKCLLQIQHSEGVKKYNGPIDCANQLYKAGGIKSIYRGSCATLLRDVPASGLYFATYEGLKTYLTRDGKPLTLSVTILAGGLAGIFNWLVAIPADVLKSQLQTAPEGTYKNGIRDVYKELIKRDGYKGLYRGAAPVLIRAFPANAACFLGYEFAISSMNYFETHVL